MFHRSSRRAGGLGAILAVFLLASACGDSDASDAGSSAPDSTVPPESEVAESDATPQYGGQVAIGLTSEPAMLLPGVSTSLGDGTVSESIFDPLLKLTGDGEIEPFLAASFEPNDDLSEWTLVLRPDVTFHDGSPLDADTVAWNIETLHLSEESSTRGNVRGAGLTGVRVEDELTVTFELGAPNAGFPDLLTTAVGMPISRVAFEAMGADAFGRAPVGTGPFSFVSWVVDDRLVVERYSDYWRVDDDGQQLPYLDRVEFRVVPDETTRVQALQSDDLQIVQVFRGGEAETLLGLADTEEIGAHFQRGDLSTVSLINTMVPPVDDVRIRTALVLSNDSTAIAQTVGSAELTPVSTGFVGADSPWYSEDTARTYPGFNGRDLTAAQDLVEQYRNDPDRSDGRPPGDPVTVTYTCHNEASVLLAAQVYQQLFSESGIDLQLEQVDLAGLSSAVVGSADSSPPFVGSFQVACFRAGMDGRDPFGYLSTFFGPVDSSPSNVTNFTSSEIDEQLQILRGSSDFAERYEAFQEVSRISNEQSTVVWSSTNLSVVGWRNDVRGVVGWSVPSGAEGTNTPNGRIHLAGVFIASP